MDDGVMERHGVVGSDGYGSHVTATEHAAGIKILASDSSGSTTVTLSAPAVRTLARLLNRLAKRREDRNAGQV